MAAFPLATRLLAVWNGWTAGRRAPARAEIDPLAMPELLPHVILLDACNGDFRFRLAGEAVNGRYGHRLKGRTLRELMLPGRALDETLYEHRRCAEDLVAALTVNSFGIAGSDDRNLYARLLLPVELQNGRACLVLGLMEFFNHRQLNAGTPTQALATNPW